MNMPRYVTAMFLRHPIIVVVRAELYFVQSKIEYERMNPMTHEPRNWIRNKESPQCS